MNQVEYTCTDCGWQGRGDKYRDLCPACGCFDVHHKVSIDGESVNDSRREPQPQFEVSPSRNVYSEAACRTYK